MLRLSSIGVLLAYVVLDLVLPLPAQQARPANSDVHAENIPRLIPRTRAEREQRFVAQHRVILNVRVADASGAPQTGLTQSDFSLYDNDELRPLVSFRAVNGNSGAAHIILVIDAVNNYTKQLRYFTKEIEKFLKMESGPLPVPLAIGVFSGYSIEVGSSSRDRDALLSELASRTANIRASGCIAQGEQSARMNAPFSPGGMGSARAESPQELTCKNDRFVYSINALSQLARKEVDVPGRLVLIWLGQGWPMLTDRAFAPDPPDLKENFFVQLVSLSMQLREAQITVDAVGSPDDSINPETPNVRDTVFFGGVTDADQVSAAHFGLHVFAHQTGGKIVRELKDVAGQLGACMAEAESYYVLSFDPPPAANFGEYHSLAVRVNQPGLDVSTNSLYYAEQ